MLSADRAPSVAGSPFMGTPFVKTFLRLILGSFIASALIGETASAEYAYGFQKPVTTIAANISSLHNTILIICCVIFVVVFGFMFWAIFNHRKSRGHKAATFHDHPIL